MNSKSNNKRVKRSWRSFNREQDLAVQANYPLKIWARDEAKTNPDVQAWLDRKRRK